jgi:hypothetical protein
MALLDDIVNGGNLVTGLAIGVGVLIVLPLAGPVLRPLAKTAIKGGLIAYGQTTRLFGGTGEEVRNVVAEAQREIGTMAWRETGQTPVPQALLERPPLLPKVVGRFRRAVLAQKRRSLSVRQPAQLCHRGRDQTCSRKNKAPVITRARHIRWRAACP